MPSVALLHDVHDFWCGRLPTLDHFPEDRAGLWFERRDETDELIRARFGSELDAVAAADWQVAALSPAEAIGLIVMLDQFPRNLFREDARAFAHDAVARRHARALVDGGVGRFALVERCFLYLPFEHSESLADQELSVRLYDALAAEAPPRQAEIYRTYLDFAVRHRDLIRRFGRFPHRNAVLGRTSTAEEAAFLAEHGRGY